MNEFETLYREHASKVFRFAWGLCADRSLAEEIVSETFVRILTKAPRIETRTAVAYLLTVARNVYLDGQRRRRREIPLPDDLPTPDADPLTRLVEQAHLTAALTVLHELPEGERAALLLRVDQDMPYTEIAAVLGISEGAAKVRVHRARLRIASTLELHGGKKDEARSDT